uniref:Putative lectin/glucanase superfamily protein n=1 Tax=viral metagenome TaxID=1070528 RepID=A0A6M3KQH3_9ZZZZ
MLKYFLKSCAVLLLSLSLVSNCGGAVFFNGDADEINIGDIDLTGSITIAAWIYPDFLEAASNDIVSKGATTGSNYTLRMKTTGKIAFNFYSTGAAWHEWITDDAVIAATTWQHVAVTYTYGTGASIVMYVNGVPQAGSWAAGNGNAVPLVNNDSGAIGQYGRDVGPANYWDGTITEVYIWNALLTQPQISLLSDSKIKGVGLQIALTSLLAYWPLDENPLATGINAVQFDDYSGNGNNGTGVDADGDSLIVGETILSYPPRPMGN